MKAAFICSLVILLTAHSDAQFGGSISTNPNGGQDGSINYSRGIGTPNHNLVGTAFGSGNSRGGPPTYGGAANYNNNGHGLSFQHSRTPGAGTTNTFGGKVNVFDNGNHKINVNGFKSQTRWRRQLNGYDRYGGNVEWQHKNGHGASLGVQSIPQFNHKSIDLNTNARLWNSNDRRTSLDWNNNVSKNIGQYNPGKTNFNTGIGLTHRF